LKQKIIHFSGFIVLSLFILSLAVAITINFSPLYSFDINYLNIAEYVDMPKEQLLINYRMLDYIILAISVICVFWFLRYMKRTNQYQKLNRYFKWGMLIPLAILFALLISFDTLFVLFHQVFFNNDAWLFNPATDSIILALPAEFFMHSFILAFGLIEVFLLIGYFITKKESLFLVSE